MDTLINFANKWVWNTAEAEFELFDVALDFVHPIFLLALFIGFMYAIKVFLPAWVGFSLIVLAGVPLISAMGAILYAGLVTLLND